jgi:hypothetical protein
MYGFAVSGLADPSLLGPADPAWPRVAVAHAPAPDPRTARPAGTVLVEDGQARIWIADGGLVEVRREGLRVTFATPERLRDQVVIHPYLGLPLSIANRWVGRHAFHGGAFVLGGRAWLLMGDKEAGKSSTLGWMLREGHQVVSDDILVLDGRVLFAGPRCIDLRPEAARVLGGETLGRVGGRERLRLPTGAAPTQVPVGGVIHLAWGERVDVQPLESSERLVGLIGSAVLRPRSEDELAFLELMALPAWRFVRPRRLERMDEANAQLLGTLP